MTTAGEHDELFREASCNGDIESLNKFLEVFAVDINCANKVNGWTALHWACKRNHISVVEFLLQKGVNKEILTSKGEKAVDLTTSEDIIKLLGSTQNSSIVNQTTSSSTFTPNYLANPVFPYTQPVLPASGNTEQNVVEIKQSYQNNLNGQSMQGVNDNSELVLKIRVAYLDDRDYIEVEMDKSNLTYEALKSVMCKELGIERRLINKIRKLPNTILRKDKDVQRLCDFQELEVVLTNNRVQLSGGTPRGFAAPIKNQEVLY